MPGLAFWLSKYLDKSTLAFVTKRFNVFFYFEVFLHLFFTAIM